MKTVASNLTTLLLGLATTLGIHSNEASAQTRHRDPSPAHAGEHHSPAHAGGHPSPARALPDAKVRFKADRIEGQLTVTHIEPAG